MTVMVTGRTGFLGSHFTKFLKRKKLSLITPVRAQYSNDTVDSDLTVTSLLDLTEREMERLKVEHIIHCAGLAHSKGVEPTVFKEVNTDLTKTLATRAANAGVKRFIFISSIGVSGHTTYSPFRADAEADPYDPYTESKYLAEKELKAISEETGMEVVIIRPPLIYGANAPGNFAKFVKLASLPVPKPLGSINNKRSFVSVDNLSDFTYVCLSHPAAANETFLVSDGEDLSTTEFLRKISNAMGKRAMLIPFPVNIMKHLASLTGQQKLVDKLTVNLQIDIEKNKALMGWEPKVSVDEALRKAFQNNN